MKREIEFEYKTTVYNHGEKISSTKSVTTIEVGGNKSDAQAYLKENCDAFVLQHTIKGYTTFSQAETMRFIKDFNCACCVVTNQINGVGIIFELCAYIHLLD